MSGLAQDVRQGGRVPLMSGLARRWPITTFYLLTLAISWPMGLLPPGVSIAAIAVAALIDGRREVGALLRKVVVWRVGVRWYLIAILGPVALLAAAASVNVLAGAQVATEGPLVDWLEMGRLFGFQVVGVIAGAWEELGWRGYALPRLLKRTSPLTASLGLGVLWAVWHIPLFVSGDLPWADAAALVVLSILFTAVFVRTKQSVLIAFLMHASLNAAGGIAILLFGGSDRVQMYWSMTAVTAVVAFAVISTQARWWLSKPHVAHEPMAVDTAVTKGVGA
ncbi:MAG TPA: CPBP family intramembrane glutamic endopeptidase [Acidimicrobiia bacterium]|nr:CPBP family intramembrane glutamic endopeptidase [Acidimicrobiia bacterium]